VLEALEERSHLTADEVFRTARERLGAVSLQAVYDVLHVLTGAGMVRRTQPAGSSVRYEVRAGDNHHHVVCRGCGATADVDCAVGSAPCLEPAAAAGFTIDEAEVIWWGRCASCGAAPSN
jgi:Fur family ferric uptake transcriptional regulator